MTLIQCCDLSLGYEGKCVLSHLELSVQEGDYLAIVGENGAGKSTLLKGILGLIRPTGGHIHFHLPPKEIGYLPQQTPIQRDFPASVMEVVLSGLLAAKGFAPFYTRADRETALAKLRLLGAGAFLRRLCWRWCVVVVAVIFPAPVEPRRAVKHLAVRRGVFIFPLVAINRPGHFRRRDICQPALCCRLDMVFAALERIEHPELTEMLLNLFRNRLFFGRGFFALRLSVS